MWWRILIHKDELGQGRDCFGSVIGKKDFARDEGDLTIVAGSRGMVLALLVVNIVVVVVVVVDSRTNGFDGTVSPNDVLPKRVLVDGFNF